MPFSRLFRKPKGNKFVPSQFQLCCMVRDSRERVQIFSKVFRSHISGLETRSRLVLSFSGPPAKSCAQFVASLLVRVQSDKTLKCKIYILQLCYSTRRIQKITEQIQDFSLTKILTIILFQWKKPHQDNTTLLVPKITRLYKVWQNKRKNWQVQVWRK